MGTGLGSIARLAIQLILNLSMCRPTLDEKLVRSVRSDFPKPSTQGLIVAMVDQPGEEDKTFIPDTELETSGCRSRKRKLANRAFAGEVRCFRN